MAKKRANITEILAANLRENRRKKGFTQEQFAELANISLRYIAMLELGNAFPSGEMLEKLAKTLDIQTYQLFTPTATPEGAMFHLEQTIVDNIGTVISQNINQSAASESGKQANNASAKEELEKLRQDILKDIKTTINKTIKQAFAAERKRK